MDGNKLKHNFVKKQDFVQNFINDWSRLEYQRGPITIETSNREWETIVVSEEISNTLLRHHDDEGNYVDVIKKDMVRKLSEILYEGNFIEIIQTDHPTSDGFRIIMRLNVEKR